MDRKIKLIWDFRGPESLPVAQHHEIHLKEFIEKDSLKDWQSTGVEQISAGHSIAWWIVPEKEILRIRDLLKPQRAVVKE